MHSPNPSKNELARLLRQETILINERKTLASPAWGCAGRWHTFEMKTLLQFVLIFYSTLTFAQDKTYVLTKKKENSDIDYKLFQTFNDFEIYENDRLKRAFEPVEGNFTICVFISEFKGLSFDGTEKMFHDYLILKLNPETKEVLDGYQYTLEWAEPPAISDLYRVTTLGERLVDGMNLNKLGMELVESDYRNESRVNLKDDGLLKLK